MSSEGSPNGVGHRRGSITQAALSQLFQRGSGTNLNGSNGPPMSGALDAQRRRLSVTTIGLSGTSPTSQPSFNIRRGSMSTSSDSIDESAIEDDEMSSMSKTVPNTPFARRMSFGGSTMRSHRPGGNSPGNGNDPTSPPPSLVRNASQGRASAIAAALSAVGRRASTATASSTDQPGFNWSEQLRTRAESSVTGARPSFSLASSPPRSALHHDRAKSVSDMMQPPVQAPAVQQPKQEPRKPDAFQERILKGDFYMD